MSNHEFTRNIAETLRMVEKRDLRNKQPLRRFPTIRKV